jgi:hypothetical protein
MMNKQIASMKQNAPVKFAPLWQAQKAHTQLAERGLRGRIVLLARPSDRAF